MSEECGCKKKRGCCLFTCGGCIAVVILLLLIVGLAIGGIVWLFKGQGSVQNRTCAVFIEEIGAFTINKLPSLTEAEQKNGLEAVKELSEAVKAGKAGDDNISHIFSQLASSKLTATVMLLKFSDRFLEGDDNVNEEDREGAPLEVRRFIVGIADSKIPQEKLLEIIKICMNNPSAFNPKDFLTACIFGDGPYYTFFKDVLSPEETAACIKIMRESADAAGIPKENVQIDFKKILKL